MVTIAQGSDGNVDLLYAWLITDSKLSRLETKLPVLTRSPITASFGRGRRLGYPAESAKHGCIDTRNCDVPGP